MLYPEETLVLAMTESREVRFLAEALAAIIATGSGIVVALLFGWSDDNDNSWKVLIQIAFVALPVLFFAAIRGRARVVLTEQRLILIPSGAAPQSLDLSHIRRVSVWFNNLRIHDAKGVALVLPNLRESALLCDLLRQNQNLAGSKKDL
ncbi:hypothetical protein [Primorskyibacter sp. S187A]|uniref:hypothetical protein n=1 Tax=Primorskyibacter sp. S187A TaxID=3415130 RepID=UPI003C7D8305